MSWEDYFECKIRHILDGTYTHYEYKDKNVVALPADLPMPPIDRFYRLFSDCKELQDISVLANWNISSVKDMTSMFWGCKRLKNITALANWDVSNVSDMQYMFYGCRQLQDISALTNWNIKEHINIDDMFYDNHEDINITTLLRKRNNHDEPIYSELLPFYQPFNELKVQMARLEEKIDKLLTVTVQRLQKDTAVD